MEKDLLNIFGIFFLKKKGTFMQMKSKLHTWKNPLLLLIGIGVANVGSWIYFIALNLIVLDMTGSPLAVSGLYIIKPFAALVTNVWSGSLIDRFNKRNLMIGLDFTRALLIFWLPFVDSLWAIYVFVFFINMAGAMFEQTSRTYITQLIQPEDRKRFNSLRSLIDSGGFLIGPAIAGLLFLIGTPSLAIFINAAALFLSGWITFFLPNLESNRAAPTAKFSFNLLKKDWAIVIDFSRKSAYIMLVYFLFSCLVVLMTAVDSLEAAFSKEILLLSDTEYGFLVSVAGAGVVVGALVNVMTVKKMTTSLLIGLGSVFVSIGYLIYAFSNGFLLAAIGFFVLSFFLAFANTGFQTFYQNNIPVEVMGRVGSVYAFVEALLVIVTTAIFGAVAQIVSIRIIVIIGTLIMLVMTIFLSIILLHPYKSNFHPTAKTRHHL
jgi:MFS family permease